MKRRTSVPGPQIQKPAGFEMVQLVLQRVEAATDVLALGQGSGGEEWGHARHSP